MGNATSSLPASAHRVLRAGVDTFKGESSSSSSNFEIPLIFQCENLNAGRDFLAIVLEGSGYSIAQGRGHGISIGTIEDALPFRIEGSFSNMILRYRNDDRLALEVNYRKLEVGTALSLWYTSGHKEWACRFSLNPETRTISPLQSPHLVLGCGPNKRQIVLVREDDVYHRFQFVPDAQNLLADRLTEMVLQRELRQAQVQQQLNELCAPERLKLLKQDGLLHLSQVVDKKVRASHIYTILLQL